MTYVDLQSKYVDLYVELRRYILDFKTVESLAELEVSVYKTFPDLDEVSRNFNKLKLNLGSTYKDDEELSKALDKFEEILNSGEIKHANLNKVTEVI